MPPRIAVLTPAYNAARFLGAAIESVRSQTHTAWLLIIVNDGSTDDTEQIARDYAARDQRILVLSQENKGIGATRNTALAAVPADCSYFLNLDSDDILEPNALEVLAAHLEAHPEAGAVFCGSTIIDAQGRTQGVRKTHRFVLKAHCPKPVAHREGIPFFNFYCGYGVGPFALLRRSTVEEAGPYNTGLFSCEDVDMFARLSLISEIHQISAPLYRYRWHDQNTSSYNNKNQEAMDRFHRLWEEKKFTHPRQIYAYEEAVWFYRKWHPLILHGKFAVAGMRNGLREKKPLMLLRHGFRLAWLCARSLFVGAASICGIGTPSRHNPQATS